MSFDDSTTDSYCLSTPRHFVFAVGRDEAFYTTFSRLKLAVANISKTRPERRAKISRCLFMSQRNCAFIQSFATYFSRGLFKTRLIFARINGPNDRTIYNVVYHFTTYLTPVVTICFIRLHQLNNPTGHFVSPMKKI